MDCLGLPIQVDNPGLGNGRVDCLGLLYQGDNPGELGRGMWIGVGGDRVSLCATSLIIRQIHISVLKILHRHPVDF